MRCLWCCAMLMMSLTLSAQRDSALSLEVNFRLDSDRLSDAEKQKIDSLLGEAPATVLKSVQIFGHTDSLASLDYNRQLSKRRVQS
ncbi:MAG: OmpA family protein, partial [Owenweeksia sp.]